MSLTILNRQRKVRFDTRAVRPRFEAVAEEAGVLEREVAVVFLSDAAIRGMNRKWRGIDRPTDCISFPACEGEGSEFAGPVLGDVFISLQTAARQARKSLDDELVHLFAHSLLHLMGHDHGTDAEAEKMEREERRLVRAAARRS